MKISRGRSRKHQEVHEPKDLEVSTLLYFRWHWYWTTEESIPNKYDTSELLGVKLEHDADTGSIEMRQGGLIDKVISQMGLDDGAAKVK